MSKSPADLSAFSYNITKWRKTRAHKRERLPDVLRQEIPDLCRRYGVPTVSKESNLDAVFIRRVLASQPTPGVKLLPVKIKNERAATEAFPVELMTSSGVSIKISSEHLKKALVLLKENGLC